MPTTMAMISPRPNRMTVGQTRLPMTSVTGWPRYLYESPKSPWAVDAR